MEKIKIVAPMQMYAPIDRSLICVAIALKWFLPMGGRFADQAAAAFFRNSEKQEFTWKTI